MNTPSLEDLDGRLLDGLDFCAATYALFESVRSTPEGVKSLCLRSGPTEKRLLEELLPICRYIQTYYRAGRYISVRWVNGSQSYDAELHQHGEYITQGCYKPISYLEASVPCTAGLTPKRLNFAMLDDVQAKLGKHWLNDKLIHRDGDSETMTG